MAFTLVCNENFLGITSIDFGDLNNFGGYEPSIITGTYWHTQRGTGLNAKTIYDYLIANGYGTPEYDITVANIELALDGEHSEIYSDFVDNRFWIVGGFDKGFGIYFCVDATNRIRIGAYDYDHETQTLKDDYGFIGNVSTQAVSAGSTDNIVYLCDQFYSKGTIVVGYTAVCEGRYEVTVREGLEREWYYYNNIDMVEINDSDTAYKDAINRICPYFHFANWTSNTQWITSARNSPYKVLPDPYKNTGGNTVPDGGNGEVRQSYNIDQPELPPDLLLESGIVKMYSPTAEQMNDFINFVYTSPDNIINNFKKIWVDPMQSIISLATVPFEVPKKSATEVVKFCGVSTNVAMYPVQSQYFQLDCGNLTLPEETKTFLDYNNNSQIHCFLPFVGIVSLSTNDVMDATLNLIYNVDLLTGDCLVSIKCTKDDDVYNIHYASPLYEFKGNILAQAPLTGNNYQQLYNGVLGLVETIAMPTSAGAPIKAGLDILGSQMVNVQRAGSLAGNCGELGQYFPYLIVECPIVSTTEEMYKYQGLPTNENKSINDMKKKGLTYVQVDTLRIYDIKCTDEERKEIIKLFESGVIM